MGLNALKENVHKLRTNIEEEKINKDAEFETKIKEMLDIEANFKSTIDNENRCRKDSENRSLRMLDEKYLAYIFYLATHLANIVLIFVN